MQIDEFMSEPAGVGGDALLSTLVNHVACREGPVAPAELEIILNIAETLRGRVSPEAMQIAMAKLSALQTAQEPEQRVPVSGLHLVPPCTAPEEATEEPGSGNAHDGACPQPVVVAEAVDDVPDYDHQAPEAPPVAHDPDDEAATCAPARLVTLASRPNPSERLCGMIVARGHAEALAAILRNPEARFARSSLTTIVELAASDMSLRDAMCHRSDLSDAILERLWPYLSLASKSAVLAAGCARAHAEALVICADASSEEQDEVAGDDMLRSVAEWVRAVRDREESLSHAMRTLDQQGRVVDVAALLAQFAGISSDKALALMIGSYDRGAVALARIAGCDDDSLQSLLHLRGRAGARSTADRRGPLHAFARLGEDEARRIIRGCFEALEGEARDMTSGQHCEPQAGSLAA